MEDQEEKEGNRVETIVKIAVLVWSAAMLTLSYYEPPSGKKIVDFDPTFIASVFTGVLATFGVQTSKKGAQGGGASGGVSKADMEKLIAAASQTAPAQTIRIEQAPVKITPDTK